MKGVYWREWGNSDLAKEAILGLVNWNGGQDCMHRQSQVTINSFQGYRVVLVSWYTLHELSATLWSKPAGDSHVYRRLISNWETGLTFLTDTGLMSYFIEAGSMLCTPGSSLKL